jgi:hypothetical protein
MPRLSRKNSAWRSEAWKKARQGTQNALRHGLTTIRRSNPIYLADIVALAKVFCAGDRTPEVYEAALDLALSQVTLREIRTHKQFLFSRLLNSDRFPTTRRWAELRYATSMLHEKHSLYDRAIREVPPSGWTKRTAQFDQLARAILAEPRRRKPEAALFLALPELVRITRYERKAWRIWNRAFERFLKVQGKLG